MSSIRSCRRRHVVWLVALLAGLACSAEAAPVTPQGVVYVMADDLGWELLDPARRTAASFNAFTPTLRQLRDTGLTFTNCHQYPMCAPSRVSLLTGRGNDREYVSWAHLRPGAPVFFNNLPPDVAVLYVGKWHGFRGYSWAVDFRAKFLNDRGIDYFHIYDSRNDDPSGSPFYGPRELIKLPFGERPGVAYERNYAAEKNGYNVFGPDLEIQAVCSFLQRCAANKQRFVIFYSPTLTHWPFLPMPSQNPTLSQRKAGGRGDAKYYPAMIGELDRGVNRIQQQLQSTGLKHNTVLMFTADNGTPPEVRVAHPEQATGTLNGQKGKQNGYATNVPLFVQWPAAIPPGFRTTQRLVVSEDFAPTILELMGGTNPGNLDGLSFVDVLRGRDDPRGLPAYVYFHPGIGESEPGDWARTDAYGLAGPAVLNTRGAYTPRTGTFFNGNDWLQRSALPYQSNRQTVAQQRAFSLLQTTILVREAHLAVETARRNTRSLLNLIFPFIPPNEWDPGLAALDSE